MAAPRKEQPEDQQMSGAAFRAKLLEGAKLLQDELDEQEALAQLHERLSQFPPSVREKAKAKRQGIIESLLKTLQQDPIITKIASDGALTAKVREAAADPDAETPQKMRDQAQNEPSEQNKEMDRLNAENQKLRAHVTKLKGMAGERYDMLSELRPRVYRLLQEHDELTAKHEELKPLVHRLIREYEKLTAKNKELTEKNKELTDTVTGLILSHKAQLM